MSGEPTTWVSGGEPITVYTAPQQGESQAACERRHNEAVAFMQEAYPPD